MYTPQGGVEVVGVNLLTGPEATSKSRPHITDEWPLGQGTTHYQVEVRV